MRRVLDEAFALPSPDERAYLLAGLARLIEQQGAEQLVAAPLLLPEPEFWPDRLAARGRGAAVLLRRLLSYAGMGELGVDIEIGKGRAHNLVDEPSELADPMHHAAGWFMGIENGVCYFGVSQSTLRDEEMLIGTLGHEVAHAFRDYHGLVVLSREVEEQLTDLTSVYLGFGFFTLQSSFQFKTGHYDESGQQLLFERQALGYLRPGQLALLLAAQLVVRRHGKQELAKVQGLLAPNHAAAVARAYRELEPARDDLIAELGLSAPELWPAPHVLADRTGPLVDATIRVADHEAVDRDWAAQREIAFRVRGDFSLHGFALGSASGFCSFLIEGVGAWMWALMLLLSVAGYKLGRRIESRRCSSCNHRVGLSLDQVRCSFCHTRLVGTIADVNDRTEAAESYWAAQEATRPPP